jgi:hypothetical protein
MSMGKAIAFGLIQTIPLRGMLKLRMRLGRLISGRWTSWWATVAKELYLALASLAVLNGFHNVFMGRRPILDPSLLGLEPRSFASAGLPGLISLLLAAAFLILVRGGYKRGIGDPFLQETPRTCRRRLPHSAQHESLETSRLKAWAPILRASAMVG